MTIPPSGPYDAHQPPLPPGQPGYGGQPGYSPQYPPGQPGQYHPQGYNPYGQAGPGPGGYGYAPPGHLAGWPVRVGASILDSLLVMIPMIIGVIAALAVSGNQDGPGTGGSVAIVGGLLVAVAIGIWNRVVRQGRTGQSFGKKLTGLKVVDARTGALIGFGRNLGREVCAQIFNQFCILNVLWPLWDAKQQTWHDKVVNDIVVRA